jgi:dihydrofolate synthase/folylpolyglutamate synthase
MQYQETLRYLDTFVNYEKASAYPYKKSFKLQRMKGFLQTIGDPQGQLKCIHVAGTKGKGSVCAFTAYMLQALGYRVGLYTSPHLSSVRERIRVFSSKGIYKISTTKDEFAGMVPLNEFILLVNRLRPLIDRYCRISSYGPLSFFEVYTALAFEYFKEKKVDFAVLETGLGGRLDATNVVEPLVVGITSISYDHINKLGNSLVEIAQEKAGIINGRQSTVNGPRLMVVSAPQRPVVSQVLRQRCKKENAQFIEIGKDIKIQKLSANRKTQRFSVSGYFGEYNNITIKLLGSHQIVNAVQALSLVDGAARKNAVVPDKKKIKAGLRNAVWPGRFEIISHKPLIVLDGAHNEDSARVLKATLKQCFPKKEIILILGISHDKDVAGICRHIVPISKQIILTKARNPRACPPEQILSLCRNKQTEIIPEIKQALKAAKQKAGKNCIIVVTGSLFVVAQAREYEKRSQ